jgi:hypothetical protein
MGQPSLPRSDAIATAIFMPRLAFRHKPMQFHLCKNTEIQRMLTSQQ